MLLMNRLVFLICAATVAVSCAGYGPEGPGAGGGGTDFSIQPPAGAPAPRRPDEGIAGATPEALMQEAYEHHRSGLIHMSMARFSEAVDDFGKAAALYSDYEILGRSLVYTPIFMTGWAYEKTGDLEKACMYFRKFLERSSPDHAEETKVAHAKQILDQCRE